MLLNIVYKSLKANIKLAFWTRNPFNIFHNSIVCKGDLKITGRIYGFRKSHIQIEPFAELLLDRGIHASENLNIRCVNHIKIGSNCRIAPNTIISDATYKNLGTECPELIKGIVVIGKNCFIGAFNLICGEVRIFDNVIIGSHMIIRNKSLSEGTLLTQNKK